MKGVIAFLILAALCARTALAASTTGRDPAEYETMFHRWKKQHGRTYTGAEHAHRLTVFSSWVDRIDAHNPRYDRGEVSHYMGLNQFSDMTEQEFKDTVLMDEAHSTPIVHDDDPPPPPPPQPRQRPVFGLGLSKTGTSSLAAALSSLGHDTIHNDRAFVPFLHADGAYNATRYFDEHYGRTTSVVDLPTAAYPHELLAHYGRDALFVLTERDPDAWFASFTAYLERLCRRRHGQQPATVAALLAHVYGSAEPDEKLWKQRFVAHNRAVRAAIPSDQLLVMDITKGDGWPQLCAFLGRNDGPCAAVAAAAAE